MVQQRQVSDNWNRGLGLFILWINLTLLQNLPQKWSISMRFQMLVTQTTQDYDHELYMSLIRF